MTNCRDEFQSVPLVTGDGVVISNYQNVRVCDRVCLVPAGASASP